MPRSLKQRQVKTAPAATPAAAPRLPHERDEAADSQESDGPREDMQQAFDDLENGLIDTDLRGKTPGTAEANRSRKETSAVSSEGRTRDPNRQKLPDGTAKKKNPGP